MSTDSELLIEPLEPYGCEWESPPCSKPAKFRVSLGETRHSYVVCGIHRRPLARWILSETAFDRAEIRRRAAREEARRVAALEAMERERQALHERIKAADEKGEIYPLVLPPGVPEFLRDYIQGQIVERG